MNLVFWFIYCLISGALVGANVKGYWFFPAIIGLCAFNAVLGAYLSSKGFI